MNEQELRDNEFRADMENALHQNRSLTMIAQTIWELAKAYAGAREAKASNKVAEIRRLCKAFLYDLPCSHNVAVISDFLDAYADNKILDEFKKTVVAAKDTEIAELKAQVEGLKTDMQHSRLIEAAQVKESNELKAEIKRLRDFTEKCHKSPEKLVQVVWFADGSFDYCDLVPLQDAAAIALSPAPVTHQPDILTKILALPDDTSSAYIKALIHDQIKLK